MRVNWSSKLKLTGKTSIFRTYGLLRIQQPVKTVVDPLLLICWQRRFHLFISIQKSTCKAPKHFLARNPMQKIQSSTFDFNLRDAFLSSNYEQMLAKWILLPSSNRHFQNGECSNVTKITTQLTTADHWMQAHWFRALKLKYYNSRHFRQELTKLLISVDELPQYILLYFQKMRS